MQRRDIDELGPRLVSTVAIPSRKFMGPLKTDPVLVGFDTEFRPSDQSLLSVQLAVRGGDGVVKTKVIYPVDPKLTPVLLTEMAVSFLEEVDRLPPLVGGVRRIVFIAHYAAAELGGFTDALRDLHIQQIGKAHHAQHGVEFHDALGPWRWRIVDLFAYYAQSLKSVGNLVGLPKLEEDPMGLESLLQIDPARFEAYAARDAEIALVAFESLRAQVLQLWGIDVLRVPSLAALASAIFRQCFLQAPPVPFRPETESVSVRRQGGWVKRSRTVRAFNGEPGVRNVALESYWGGRTEALGRGLLEEPVVEWDVRSLYPSAALLQPLPNAKTRWRAVTKLDDIAWMEGFGRFTFEFPESCPHPCLPVVREGAQRLTFPLSGETACTFAEVYIAVVLGAQVRIISAWGFKPGPTECDHDLGRYFRQFMKEKAAATKGTLSYETPKLLMNALIGKLAEHSRPSHLLNLERVSRRKGASGLTAAIARSGSLRSAVQGAQRVGSLWSPEWASLILGRARAIMAELLAMGGHLISTDAILAPAHLSFEGPALAALKKVGSDLERKVEGDALFVARSRLYAVLQRADQIRPGATVYARNERWAVVRVARHGSQESEEQFAQTVLACLDAGQDAAQPRTRTRLVSAESAVREHLEINQAVERTGQTGFGWDSKRRLVDRDVNVFAGWSETAPYSTLAKLEGAEHQRELRAGTARRRRKPIKPKLLAIVVARIKSGESLRSIASETGIPKSTIADLKQRHIERVFGHEGASAGLDGGVGADEPRDVG